MQILTQQAVEVSADDARAMLTDPDFTAQRKLDGKRCVLQIQGGRVQTLDRTGSECPEIGFPVSRNCVLDGELIGDEFTAFDLLSLDGQDWRTKPQEERFDMLLALGMVPIVEHADGDLGAFVERAKSEGWEGVVFKRKSADYRDVSREYVPRTFKLKFRKSASFIVNRINEKASIGIATVDGADRGNVAVTNRQTCPKIGDIVEVEYLYANRKSGKLTQPKLLAIRFDVPRERCTANQLRFKTTA